MTHDDGVMARELVIARLQLHRATVPTAVMSAALAVAAVAFILRGIAERPLQWIGITGLVLALALRVGTARAYDRRAGGTTPEMWLLRFRGSYAVHGLVWMVITLRMTSLASPAEHALVVFAMTALTAGALVTTAFDWVAGVVFGGLTFVPLLLSLDAAGDTRAGSEMVVAVMFLAVMLLTLRRSELSLRLSVRRDLATRASAVAARQLADEADQARRALADQDRLMGQLLATTRQGCWFIDSQGITTDVNAAMCQLMGLPREVLVGRPAWDFFSGAALATLQREVAKRRSGLASAYAISITRPDGTQRHCQNNASPLLDTEGRYQGSVGLWTDLTEMVEAAHELQVHAWAINSITDAVSVISEDAIYRMVNDAWCHNTGVPREQAIGASARTLLPSLSSDARIAALQACMASNQVQVLRGPVELPALRGRTVQTHLYPYSGQDNARCVVMVSRDVTAEEQVLRALQTSEAEQTEARAEAERANRAKSQFLAQMSHELRTPLNAILGFAELLDTDAQLPLTDLQRGQLHEIRRGGQHLLGLVNEVLELGRIEAGHLDLQVTPVALRELLTECLNLVQPLAHARPVHLLPLHADAAARHVRADPLRLKQVLLNLLGNAIKYNRPGGVVEVAWAAQGPRVQISVRDTGPGLAPADQARAFEPFERLEAASTDVEGAGIGLALSQRLVLAMGGEIGVDSQVGHGSTFWVRLPRANATVASMHSATAVADGLAGAGAGGGTPAVDTETTPPALVLYIEDNPVNLELMTAMLARMAEVRARCVISAREGLALAAAEPPDLILLDLQMPVMDGFEVLRRLRADPALRDIPVYAVSANALSLDIEAARAAGFDGYLTKPIQLDTLIDTVRGALRARRLAAAR